MYHQQKYAVPLEKYGTYSNKAFYSDNGRVYQRRNRVASARYATELYTNKAEWSHEDRIPRSVWSDRKLEGAKIFQDIQNELRRTWFKITIQNGRKYSKMWILNSIKSICRVPFTAVDFHYNKNYAQFFVQHASTASALRDASFKICNEKNQKLIIFVTPCVVPYSVRNKFTPDQLEKIKLVMMKRYDVSSKYLDLHKLSFDQELMSHGIDMMLNQRSCMFTALKVIERNMPELLSLNLSNNKLYQLDGLSDMIKKAPEVRILNLSKNNLNSVLELDKVKELKLEELWLENNPLCTTFRDKSAYVSAIREKFPTLICLDGKKLRLKVVVTTATPQPKKESYQGPEVLKNLILQFLRQYYSIYDNGDRHDLLCAYHDEACFSLTIPFNPNDTDQSSLEDYFKYNRDLKKLHDSYTRMKLLKCTNRDIVDSLSMLPKTQHDLSSFWMYIVLYTDQMLCFSVNGVFKEVEGKYQGCVRAFTRTLIAVPNSSSSMCIVNDEMVLRNANPGEIQGAFIQLPTVCSTSTSTLSREKQKMVKAFSEQSGMKLHWSQKCLDDNQWDYTKAGQIFITLQTEGKIPKEFFK